MSQDSDIRSSDNQGLHSSSRGDGSRKVSARRKRSSKAGSASLGQGGAHVRQDSPGAAAGYGAKVSGGKGNARSSAAGRGSAAASQNGVDAAGSRSSGSAAGRSTMGHGSGSSKTGSSTANRSVAGSASKISKGSSAKAAKNGSESGSKRASSKHGSDRNSRTIARANAKSGSAPRNSRGSKGGSSKVSGDAASGNSKGYARNAGTAAGTASGVRGSTSRSGTSHGNAKGNGTLSADRSAGSGSKGVSSSKGTKASGSRNTASGKKAAGSVAGVNANGTGTSAASTEMARKAARSQRKASRSGGAEAAKASKGGRNGTKGRSGISGGSSQRNSRSNSNSRGHGNGFVWAGRVVAVVVVALALFYVVDGIANFGKVHSNVTVGDVEVSGLTQAEAAEAIDAEYSSVGEDATITLYASEEAMSSDEEPTEITFDYDTIDEFTSDPPDAQVFTVTTSDLEAYVDGESLAEQAYSVGRGKDFFLGRLGAVLFGKNIDLEVTTDDIYTEALEEMLTSALGVAMTNPGIAYDEEEGSLVTTIGNDGYMVEEEQFLELLGEAIISGGNSLVVPMADVYMEIDDEAAEEALFIAQQATQEPVTLELDGLSWELDSVTLGELTTTFIDGKDLIPYIGYENLEEYVPTLEGLSDECTEASDVLFEYNGTTLSYTEASTGMGPDYEGLAERMNSIVYGSEDLVYESGELDVEEDDSTADSSEGSSSEESDEADSASDGSSSKEEEDYTESDAARVATIVLEVTEPEMTYEDAVSLGLNAELICEYSTSYASASSGKSHNIELLSSILTNTVVAPGETFSLNDTAGECNEEKGFEEANAIVNGEYSSEIGGGICQVATTVFDAVFNAGYPIVERHNHSTYVSSYEDGLDAAIAYPYLDFKFKNDTDNYLMILLDCDGSTVTCSLWGVSPGYTTEYEMVSWEEGEEYEEITREDSEELEGTEYIKSYGSNGHIVVIERDTYDSNGDLIREDTFTSEYAAVDEVTIIGTGTSESSSDGTT